MYHIYSTEKPWTLTTDGNEVSEEAREILTTFFAKWVARGVSPRELSHLLIGNATERESYHCLKAGLEIINEKRRQRSYEEIEDEMALDKFDVGPHSNKGG